MYTKWLVSARSYVTHNYRETEVLFHEELPLLHASINITRIIISQYLNSSSISAPNPNSGYQAGISPAPIPSLAINTQTIKFEKFEIQISNLPTFLPSNFQRKKFKLLLRTRCQCVILISQIPGLITWQSIQRRFPTPICWNWKNWKNCIPNEYQYQISPQDQHHPPHPEPPFLIRKISISQMKIVTKNIWLITMNNNDLTWDRRSHRKGRRCWLYNSSIDNFDFVVLIRSRGKIACTDGVVMSCSCCVRYTWDRGLRIESKPIDRGK